MTNNMLPNIGFAGDRQLSVNILQYLLSRSIYPKFLMVPSDQETSHSHELIKRLNNLPSCKIFAGNVLRDTSVVDKIKSSNIDYLICIHYPIIIPEVIIKIPKYGVINLHPAYLPYNRGWHTPSWAIFDELPYGATLHFMDSGIDTGDIIHQKEINIKADDTANTLYQRVVSLEYDVFVEAWPSLESYNYSKISQNLNAGTSHKKTDLSSLQKIELDKNIKCREFIKVLRALTTNKLYESAYFYEEGVKYYLQIAIKKSSE